MIFRKRESLGRGRWHAPRVLVAVVASVAAAAGVAFTTMDALGAFNATITQNGTLTAGSIVLEETSGSTHCYSTGGSSTPFTTNSSSCSTIDVFGAPTGQLPGGAANSQSLTFENVGSSPASTFTVTPGSCTAAGTGSYYGNASSAAFCGIVDITIGNGASVCYYPAQASTACPALSSTYNLSTLATNGAVTIGSGLASLASDTIVVKTALDSSATNPDQGLEATQGFTWTISQ